MEGREALSSYIWRFRSELICVCQNRKRPRVVTQFLSCWNGCERSRSAPQNLISHKIFFLLAFFFSSFFFHKRSPRYKCLIIVLLRVIWLCVNMKVFDPWAWVFFSPAYSEQVTSCFSSCWSALEQESGRSLPAGHPVKMKSVLTASIQQRELQPREQRRGLSRTRTWGPNGNYRCAASVSEIRGCVFFSASRGWKKEL